MSNSEDKICPCPRADICCLHRTTPFILLLHSQSTICCCCPFLSRSLILSPKKITYLYVEYLFFFLFIYLTPFVSLSLSLYLSLTFSFPFLARVCLHALMPPSIGSGYLLFSFIFVCFSFFFGEMVYFCFGGHCSYDH